MDLQNTHAPHDARTGREDAPVREHARKLRRVGEEEARDDRPEVRIGQKVVPAWLERGGGSRLVDTSS